MFDFYQFDKWAEYEDIYHSVTTKSSNMAYEGSLALHTGETQVDILDNRAKVRRAIDKDQDFSFVLAQQTHRANIVCIRSKAMRGWLSQDDAIVDCDALISNIPHLMLGILTADCVPILLYDTKQKVVASVHAGWKGTRDKILLKTITKMQEIFGCEAKDIRAGIAPAIGQCCYEVGEDVIQYFEDIPQSYVAKAEKYRLNLPYLNQLQLLEVGLEAQHIELSNICTSCEVERFFFRIAKKRDVQEGL
ncbi:MAG: peptidoglycan editing factor PgeF [Sulfurovum sp.]|nr:peptidoglycan editing factor PgeF [Sulfurovum sp.]